VGSAEDEKPVMIIRYTPRPAQTTKRPVNKRQTYRRTEKIIDSKITLTTIEPVHPHPSGIFSGRSEK
jgi:hypothetical protein